MSIKQIKANAPDGATHWDGVFYYMYGAYGWWYKFQGVWRKHSTTKPENLISLQKRAIRNNV